MNYYGNLNGVDGVKTGFTNNAGRCLVTSTSRDGHQIICVVLGADTKKIRTTDSVKLIEYAYSNFEYVNIKELIDEKFEEFEKEESKNIEIIKGKNNSSYEIEKVLVEKVPIKKSEVKDVKPYVEYKAVLQAPVYKDTIIGAINVKLKDKSIYSTNIVIKNDIQKTNILDYMKRMISNYNIYINDCLTNY